MNNFKQLASPEVTEVVANYVHSPLRFSEPPSVSADGEWMNKKETIEFGFAPEVEALTDALVVKAREMACEDLGVGEVPDTVERTLREASWRLALKYYARDGWESAVLHVYNELSTGVIRVINRLELLLLKRLDWKLPFQEAADLLPSVLERQIDRLHLLITRANTAASDERTRFYAGDSSEKTAVRALVLPQWLLILQDLRRAELKALQLAADMPPVLGSLFERSGPRDLSAFEADAKRLLKKRPVRYRSAPTAPPPVKAT